MNNQIISVSDVFSVHQEFLPELVQLQPEPAAAVRKCLAELLADAAATAPRPGVLQPAAACLAALVSDSAAGVAKAAVVAALTVFRIVFAIIAHQAGGFSAKYQCKLQYWL